MKKLFLLFVFACGIISCAKAQLLLYDDFTGYTVGNNLAGQGSWIKGGTGPDATIGNATALTMTNYNGGGGEYVIMPTASSTTSRVYKGFTTTTGGTNTFFYSVLIRLTSVSSASTGYFLSLGDPATGTSYVAKLFAGSSGSGFNIGIAKTASTGTYGSTVYNLNQTYLVIVRYDYVTGTTNDHVYVWVFSSTPSSEPTTASADVTVSSGSDGPATIGNFHWHYRGTTNPAGAFDGVRVAYGATSADAWANLSAYTGGTPAHLAVISVNGGVTPITGVPFSVQVQAQDELNNAVNVTSDCGILLTSTGTIGGTTTGTILNGQNTVTISGVTLQEGYNLTITATQTSGTPTLTAGTSAAFNVLAAISKLPDKNQWKLECTRNMANTDCRNVV